MILVTTAGKVGAEVARRLASGEHAVRLLARPGHPRPELAAVGVQVHPLDLAPDPGDPTARPRALAAALHGVDTVVLVTASDADQEIAVVGAAVAAGVRHIAKITSDASADSPIGRRRDHHRVEQVLHGSGIPHTLLRANAYMQNLLMLAPAIAATGSFASAAGDGRIGMVDVRDVAAAAAVAAHPAAHRGATYWLSGPESLTYGDAATALSRALGTPVTHRPISVLEQERVLVAAGMAPAAARDTAAAMGLFAAGDGDWVRDGVVALTGDRPRTLAAFAGEYAHTFRAAHHP